MRNIIGQTKSGFNLRDIMDNKKILLVNLSKGKMGELNSKLLGIIFVMKFQAAAMGRANIDEKSRVDFSLYVDEFQNFATESFESILSEARKYRLNLILGNQFMTQLTDKIREAIIGNVGTVISGRIGITDAEILEKKFKPVFDAEDLTKLPNYQSITSVMINNVPSAPFSMSFVAPMGEMNQNLADALKRLSAAKYGKTRDQVEKEISSRLASGTNEKKNRLDELRRLQQAGPPRSAPGAAMSPNPFQPQGASAPASKPASSGSSFLDEWLAKRQQLKNTTPLVQATGATQTAVQPNTSTSVPLPVAPRPAPAAPSQPYASEPPSIEPSAQPVSQPVQPLQGPEAVRTLSPPPIFAQTDVVEAQTQVQPIRQDPHRFDLHSDNIADSQQDDQELSIKIR
jgi:hypothetical protein